MLGHTLLRVVAEKQEWEIEGTARGEASVRFAGRSKAVPILAFDAGKESEVARLLAERKPDVVVNCIGVTKHRTTAEDPVLSCRINTIFPHLLAEEGRKTGTRVVHISSDCVFSGREGFYKEGDPMDALDIYGKSKSMGELHDPHTITLRTSMIGHEMGTKFGLLEWFLSQAGSCKGFSRAYFSGLPTVVLARLIRDVVIPKHELAGVYHVAAERIDKYRLLKAIAKVYDKDIEIVEDREFQVDRSLDATRFAAATGYVAPSWPDLLMEMREDYKSAMSDTDHA